MHATATSAVALGAGGREVAQVQTYSVILGVPILCNGGDRDL